MDGSRGEEYLGQKYMKHVQMKLWRIHTFFIRPISYSHARVHGCGIEEFMDEFIEGVADCCMKLSLTSSWKQNYLFIFVFADSCD